MAKPGNKNSAHSGRCPAVENPLTTFARLLAFQLHLCDELEQVADSLPHQMDRTQCRKLAGVLNSALVSVHTVEESIIFPALVQLNVSDQLTQRTVDRLISEHRIDEGYGEEVSEILMTLSEDDQVSDMNCAGYALRGFFECVRRNVHFELEYILPFARKQLRSEDLDSISSLLHNYQMILSESCMQTQNRVKDHTPDPKA